MASKAASLSDPGHRIRFVYLPKHTSWLNLRLNAGLAFVRRLPDGHFTDELQGKS